MTIRFSEAGPEIPPTLLDALIAGDVVFVCGAGVSMPQLDDFRTLTRKTFERLRVDMDSSEQRSFDAERYEEALGSLGRRLVDPADVVHAVSALLAVPDKVVLDRHATVLRLSRDIENRVIVVTTNFDTLIERSLARDDDVDVRAESAAGQGLPPPGGADFHGVIHMHGRLRDEELGLESTPLVLTSADYGDAYMRSGWASRFLFDLIRCKTIVLVGYSAADAPVRYFLSVLAADRARFPALHPVYAFDGVFDDVGEADARWGALAVNPIPYLAVRNPETGAQDHSALWDDLARLADVVELPKASRKARAADLLRRPLADLTPLELSELDWLFHERDDLWDVVIRDVADEAWFDHFRDRNLWTDRDAGWIIAAWSALDPENRVRFSVAQRWMARLGEPFAKQLKQRMRQKAELQPLWFKAWRLLCLDPRSGESIWDDGPYDVLQMADRDALFDRDLQKAIDLLTPRLEVDKHGGALYGDPPPDPPQRIHDIVWPRLRLDDKGALPDLLTRIPAFGRDRRILDLATTALTTTLETARDAEMIQAEYDAVDAGLPSVEPHRQNDHHDGVVHLVWVLATLLPTLANQDRGAARRLAENWKALPGRLGLRLWLHAARHPGLFGPNEVVTGLLGLPELDFWTLRRELALALRDGLAGADEAGVRALEGRILDTAGTYFGRYEIDPGQMDWRPHAQDAEVWLRLNMLERAGLTSQRGADELTAIKRRRDYLDRAVEDRDFFGSYSTGVTVVTGDPTPILEATDEDRLRVALDVRASRDLNAQHGWSAYARQDPEGAFRTLSEGALTAPNASLWQEFIGTLVGVSDAEADPVRRRLGASVFRALAGCDDAFLELVADRLVDLLWVHLENGDVDGGAWWDRLWGVVEAGEDEALKVTDLYGQAINRPAGRLTQIALKMIDAHRAKGDGAPAASLERISRVGAAGGFAGTMARAVLAHDLAFVLAIAEASAVHIMDPALNTDDEIGGGLRRVVVEYASVTPLLTRRFGGTLVRAAIESDASDSAQVYVASKILIPVGSVLSGDKNADAWGISSVMAAQAVRAGNTALRVGAIDWFGRALQQEADPAAAWTSWMSEMFEAIWPRERRFRDESFSRYFAQLAVAAGAAFPDAFRQLRPYIAPVGSGRGGLFALRQSDAPEKFPRICLDLLWTLLGTSKAEGDYELPKLLDRLVAAEPRLERDRRLQALEQRVVRYE